MIKYTLLVLVLFISSLDNLFSQENTILRNKPEISLTLIPPSPVTDQITLDIRAGIRNNTDVEKSLTVTFYLNKEKSRAILHQQKITIAPQSVSSVKFPWATKNNVGDHKIILVTKSNDQTLRMERPIQIVTSAIRSTKKIDGAWINFYHWSEAEGIFWNSEIKKMTDRQWGELINAQHSLDMNVIVVQEVFRNQEYSGKHTIDQDGFKGHAFYPSELFPERVPITAVDPLEAVLEAADKNGMNVFMAVGLYAWFDFSKGSLEWHKKVASELWEKYGHHPSFYGWYVSEEQDGGLGNEQDRENIVEFFRDFRQHVHQMTPDKPIMLATNSHNLRGAEDTYRKLLPYLDILCPFGFHRMPANELTGEEAAAKLQSLCDEAGMHLWMDMEAFDFFGPDNALVPRSIDGLLSDLHRFPNFEKILCYQYPGLFNSPQMSIKPGGENTVKLYLDYKKYLDSIQVPVKKSKKYGSRKSRNK